MTSFSMTTHKYSDAYHLLFIGIVSGIPLFLANIKILSLYTFEMFTYKHINLSM